MDKKAILPKSACCFSLAGNVRFGGESGGCAVNAWGMPVFVTLWMVTYFELRVYLYSSYYGAISRVRTEITKSGWIFLIGVFLGVWGTHTY